MDDHRTINGAVQAIEEAEALARAIGGLPQLAGDGASQIDRLLSALAKARAEVDIASQLLERQAAQIQQLSVVAINSTVRSL